MKQAISIFFYVSLLLAVACSGGGSFKDLSLDNKDVVTTVTPSEPCGIVATSPSNQTLTVALSPNTITTFGVVPESNGCTVEYLLNGTPVATLPFFDLSASSLNAGANTLTVNVGSLTEQESYSWTVYRNTPPSCDSQTPLSSGNSISYTNTLNLTGNALDADSDPLTFSWQFNSNTLPALFVSTTSNASSSTTVFTPTLAERGNHSISLMIDDGYDTSYCTWAVTVVDPSVVTISSCTPSALTEDPVIITSSGLSSTRTFTVNATGTGLTYSWLLDGSPVLGAIFSSLNLSAVSLPVDDYVLEAVVEDAYANTDSCSFNVKRNAPPVLSSITPATTITRRVGLDSFSLFQVTGTDNVGDTISYTWTLDNNSSGYLPSGASSSAFNPASDTNMLGSHTVKVVATDGYETAQVTWPVSVNRFSSACNTLFNSTDSGDYKKICTLVGNPSVGDGVNVGVSENQNQEDIRIDPNMVIVENVSGVDNLIISDEVNHVVWYYNRTAGSLNRFGITIPAYSMKAVVGSGQAGNNTSTPTKINTPTGIAINTDNPSNIKLYILVEESHTKYNIEIPLNQ